MAGSRPQQEEMARTSRTPLDQNSQELTARDALPGDEKTKGSVPRDNRPGSRPRRDQDKPAFLTSKIELLRERRGDQQITFADVCDHMNDYVAERPEDEDAVHRLALFLSRVEDAAHDHEPEKTGGLKEPVKT